MMYYLYIMFVSAQKVSPAPNSNSNPKCPPPSKAYITTMCEYICKRTTHDSKMRANPVNVKPVKKQHEDMFIFWT
jgi:hypothetical protein